jgi:molybdate transport system substrate-binding protein
MSLRILSAGSTLHSVRTCAGLATQTANVEIDVSTDHGHNIRDALQRGDAKADVVLLPADMVAALTAKNLLQESIPLGTVGIGGVVREGVHTPKIETMAQLRDALTSADAVLLTNAPTGEHLMDVVSKLGLRDAVAPRLLRFDTSAKLNIALAARSDNALGFGPETEIRAGTAVRWIGELPDEIQIALPYAAAIVTGTPQADAARRFIAFLGTPTAREAFAKTGVRNFAP